MSETVCFNKFEVKIIMPTNITDVNLESTKIQFLRPDYAKSLIGENVSFQTELSRLHPGCCKPDGTFACPECGGPLEIANNSGYCEQCEPGHRVKHVWNLLAMHHGWRGTARGVNHYAARLLVIVQWDRAKLLRERQVELARSALRYARLGVPVFPVHAIGPDGQCTCGNADCCSPAKHPVPRNGLRDATTDVQQICGWWSWKRQANIAIVTGSQSGLFVLDIDGDIGKQSLAGLIEEHGPLPPTVAVQTGGGGLHYYYSLPAGVTVHNSAGALAEGVDIRGEGGYVVAVPSNHKSGAHIPHLSKAFWVIFSLALPDTGLSAKWV
jgi:hypothetical protein